ncbi:MAG TPA: tetratricopeptide repeat protein [Candidatus Obscuribacterales bacterium]
MTSQQNNFPRDIAARLAVADALARSGDYQPAERFYRETLRLAEAEAGEYSPLAGIVLVDMVYFYQCIGKEADAEPLYERVRAILTKYALEIARQTAKREIS